jgi:UDP-N-acetylglucosamine:LPS N-acetylglucosamine transferase
VTPRSPRIATERRELLLVCSSGGHLTQLRLLEPVWRNRRRLWVTLPGEDARSRLSGEQVVFAHGPTTRNVPNLARNLVLAWRVVRRARPRVLLTTGAGVAVPFAWIGKLHGAKVVYVESLTRIERPSLSCRLIAPVASRIYVQWPELISMRRARFVGSVLERR